MKNIKSFVLALFVAIGLFGSVFFADRTAAQNNFAAKNLDTNESVLGLVSQYKGWTEVRMPGQLGLTAATIVNSSNPGG